MEVLVQQNFVESVALYHGYKICADIPLWEIGYLANSKFLGNSNMGNTWMTLPSIIGPLSINVVKFLITFVLKTPHYKFLLGRKTLKQKCILIIINK